MARFADSGTSLAHAAFLLQLHPIARIFVERGEPQGAAVKKIHGRTAPSNGGRVIACQSTPSSGLLGKRRAIAWL